MHSFLDTVYIYVRKGFCVVKSNITNLDND